MKVYMIFHVALQDFETSETIAAELKEKDVQLLPYTNTSSGESISFEIRCSGKETLGIK